MISLTLHDLIVAYRTHLAEDKGIANTSRSTIHCCLGLWDRELGEVALNCVDTKLFERWMCTRAREKGWTSNAAWNRYRAYGSAMFKWGMRGKVKLVDFNPFDDIDVRVEQRARPPRLADAGVPEARLLVAVASVWGDNLRKTLPMSRRVKAALDLGLRKSEIAHVHVDDINMFTWELRLPLSKGRTKTGKAEKVFVMSERLRAIFGSHDAAHQGGQCGPYVFGHLDGSYCGSWDRDWKKLFKVAGLPPSFTWHSLRHEFISSIAEHTDNVQEVKELARHASVATTEIYMKAREERLREVLRRRTEDGQP